MSVKKQDALDIIHFIDELGNEQKIKQTERSFWPSFIFHYTPIESAVKILIDGKLKSRFDLESYNELPRSIGSTEILDSTAPHKKKCVRLYFRPRTPTQYHIEGIKPIKDISRFNVHCPIPIFFLFSSKELLTLKDTSFTNGNYSKNYVRDGNTANFLTSLPFDKIYHIGPYNRHLNWEIRFHRCAEVLYPRELNLSTLKYICCRSEAEKETLLSLLPSKIWLSWHSKVIVSRTRLFEAKWTYLEKVQLFRNQALFYFSPDSRTPGPFKAKVHILNLNTKEVYKKSNNNFYTNRASYFKVTIPDKIKRYSIKFYLDDNLCYFNSYDEDDLPF